MNIQLSTFNRILIVSGLFIVIALLSFFFVFQPKKQQESLTRAQIADLQAQYQELSRVAAQKPLYIALTNQIRARLTGVEITADPRTYIPGYLKQIEDLAKRDGLIVTTVTPQATPIPSPGPSSSPTPNVPSAAQSLSQLPVVGAAAQRVQNTAAQRAANVNANAGVLPGGSPVPGRPAGAQPAAQPGGELPPGVQPGSPRAAAIAYLNQSFTQVPISMEFGGHYSALERFLRDLNKFPKLLGVGDLNLTTLGNAEVGVNPELKIVMPVTAYRLSPNSAAAQAQPTPAPTPGAAR